MDFRKWGEDVNPSQHLLLDNVLRHSIELHKNSDVSVYNVWEGCAEHSAENFEFQIWSLNNNIGSIYFAYAAFSSHLKYMSILL